MQKKSTKPSYRKEMKQRDNLVLSLYGKLVPIKYCFYYCDLHKCYLEKRDMSEKKCKKKKCNKLKKLDKHKRMV